MNFCRSCNTDFGSVAAFDAHRTGVHAYTFMEGARRVPPVEDGRRCLDVREMASMRRRDGGAVFAVNARGSWSLAQSVEAAREAFA